MFNCCNRFYWPEGFMKTGFVRINALLWADVLRSYALFVMQDYLTDVWKLSFTHASAILNILGGISMVLPVFFLFLVETLLGNFKMLVISSLAYCVGMSLVAMSMPPVLAYATGTCKQYEPECIGHTQQVLFYKGMVLLAVGSASNVVSKEPFREAQDSESLTPTTGCLRIPGFIFLRLMPTIGFIALQFVKPWTLRFGVPAICTVIVTLIFMTGWCGPWKYKKDKPGPDGSPITSVCRVFVIAASKMCISFPLDDKKYHKKDENERLKPTRFLRCLHKAAIIPEGVDPNENKWKVCPVADVEEAKIAVRMVPMMMTFIICGTVSSMRNTYFVEQAENMNRKIRNVNLPNQTLLFIFNFSKAVFCCLARNLLRKEKRKKWETRQQYKKQARATKSRYKKVAPAIGIGVGMLFSVLCCITAAKIEKRRLGVIKRHGLLDKPDEDIPMSMYWLVFQYILLAGMNAFLENSVTEFYIHQSPESMGDYLDYMSKGVFGLGFMFSPLCVYVVGKISKKGGKPSWFQDTLNRSRLDRYYWVLAGLSCVNLLVFICVAFFYRYKHLETQNSGFNNSNEEEKEDNELISLSRIEEDNETNNTSGGGEDGQRNLEFGKKL